MISKAFTTDADEEDSAGEPALASGLKNYMTPRGFAVLQDELRHLMRVERPKLVEVVSWAAANGDRSENGDYIYGKKRLREIDRRVRYLTKSLESAVIVDPALQTNRTRVFFGATVTYARGDGVDCTVTIVGVDEADMAQGKISWISPIARALLKTQVGDKVDVRKPSGVERLEVMAIGYEGGAIVATSG